MPPRRPHPLVVACVAAVLLAGCGGAGTDPATAANTPPPAAAPAAPAPSGAGPTTVPPAVSTPVPAGAAAPGPTAPGQAGGDGLGALEADLAGIEAELARVGTDIDPAGDGFATDEGERP